MLLWWFLASTPVRDQARRDDRGQPSLRRGDRRRDRVGRRLHGRPDRLVEQPDLRRGHPRRCSAPRCCWCRCTAASDDPERTTALVAYALFATAIVFGIATISNDNLQDLKTGQLVGATPWRQQVALVIGVVFGRLVIPPVLDLLNAAFGFAGAPGAGENALAAPQAALISSLAKGVLRRQPGLGPDRARRGDRCGGDRHRRGARPLHASCACRRWPSAWACTCRCR